MIVGSKHQILQTGKYANEHDKATYLLMMCACEKTTFNCTVQNVLEQYPGVQSIALIKIYHCGLFV